MWEECTDESCGDGDDDVREEASAASALGIMSCHSVLSLSISCLLITTCPFANPGLCSTMRYISNL